MKVIAETPDRCIEDPVVIKQILDQLKHKAETRESRALPESRAPPARPEACCLHIVQLNRRCIARRCAVFW